MDKYGDIMVSRNGKSINSYMITTNLVGLTKKSNFPSKQIIIPNYEPKYEKLYGDWNHNYKINQDNTNILGNSCIFDSYFYSLKIPIEKATNKNLSYYGAKLVENYQDIEWSDELPVFEMEIGDKYLDDYILQENYGKGFYLEYHNTPHFHKPLRNDSRGHLILGKKVSQIEYHLTAFEIPYGYGIYTPPYTIHNDCCLIGKYLVIYTKTNKYSTANLYYKDQLVNINFI